MAKFQPGIVVITCKSSLSSEEVKRMIKDLGLSFSDDFCVQSDFYPICVPVGKEDEVAKKLLDLPGVTSARRQYSFTYKN